jgi:hypothetical protein
VIVRVDLFWLISLCRRSVEGNFFLIALVEDVLLLPEDLFLVLLKQLPVLLESLGLASGL